MEKLVDLAESGQNLSKTGELKGLDPQGKLRGVYGFSVKTAWRPGRAELRSSPSATSAASPPATPWSRTSASRWCDVYEEDDHVLVLAEIPGVSKKDVQLELAGDRLTIRAQRGEKRYRKEVALPRDFLPGEHAMGVRQRNPEDPLANGEQR